MSAPATFSLWMTNLTAQQLGMGSGANNHGGLSSSIPPQSIPATNNTTAQGWNMGSLTAPRFVRMDYGIEVGRASTNPAWGTTSSAALPNSGQGDCWVYGPLTGDFDNTPWQITHSLKAVTLAGTQLGRFIWRALKADNAEGSGSVCMSASFIAGGAAITSSFISSSITPSLAATATQNRCTASFNLGTQSFRNQYLLFQTQFNLTTAGGANNCDADWLIGVTSGSIKTANFIEYTMKPMIHRTDDLG